MGAVHRRPRAPAADTDGPERAYRICSTRPAPRRLRPPSVTRRVGALRSVSVPTGYLAAGRRRCQRPCPASAGITRHAVAALHRRAHQAKPAETARSAGLSRTVRYIHSIIHAALKDAMRWNRVARNVADAATPPPTRLDARGRPTTGPPTSSAVPRLRRRQPLPDRRGCSSPPPAAAEASASASMGRRRPRRGHRDHLPPGDLDRPRDRRQGAAEDQAGPHDPPRLGHGRHAPALASAAERGEAPRRPRATTTRATSSASPTARPYHPDRLQPGVPPQAGALQPSPPRRAAPGLTLHGLRHTWATLALHEGIDIKVVSDRLNHSSTHITREIYTHVTPPMQSDAAERVANSDLRLRLGRRPRCSDTTRRSRSGVWFRCKIRL